MARVVPPDILDEIEKICGRYPTRLAAMLPALHLVQARFGYISEEAAQDVAEKLDVPPTRVHEVITFYTMFYGQPTGRNIVKVCRNLACQLRGAEKILARAEEVLGIQAGQTTEDGRVTLETDECLASCGTGPMLWCCCRREEHYEERIVENLTCEKLEKFLEELP